MSEETSSRVLTEEEKSLDFPVVVAEEAVSEINQIYQRHTVNMHLEIGQYVLQKFYNDDPQLYMSRNPLKSQSLTDVLHSEKLLVGATTIKNSVKLAILEREFREFAVWNQLNISSKIALLPLRKEDTIKRLAKKAAEKELSVRKLKDLVKEEQKKAAKRSDRGRHPYPPYFKEIKAVKKILLKDLKIDKIEKDDVVEVPDEYRVKIVEMAEELITKLQGFLDVLKES